MFQTSPRFPVLSLLQWGEEPGSGAKRDVRGRRQVYPQVKAVSRDGIRYKSELVDTLPETVLSIQGQAGSPRISTVAPNLESRTQSYRVESVFLL